MVCCAAACGAAKHRTKSAANRANDFRIIASLLFESVGNRVVKPIALEWFVDDLFDTHSEELVDDSLFGLRGNHYDPRLGIELQQYLDNGHSGKLFHVDVERDQIRPLRVVGFDGFFAARRFGALKSL